MLGIAKYLPEFGWQPVILSAPLDEKSPNQFTIIETGYRDALGFPGKLFKIKPNEDPRKQIRNRLGVKSKKSFLDSMMTLAGEIINYPDSEKGWMKPAVKTGEKVLGEDNFDAIISSSAPITAHVIAHKLKSHFKIPWVADLRDLWTQNHNYYYGQLRKVVDRRLELKTLGSADAIVTVSQPWAHELGTLHKGKKVYAITNGFDPDSINEPPMPLTGQFTITYTGLIYSGKQNLALLFNALKELISEKVVGSSDVEVRFYGTGVTWLSEMIQEYSFSNITKVYDTIPQKEAIERQKESQVLLLLNWEDPKVIGWHPLKGFEYLAAARPILAVGGFGGDVTEILLKETGAGVYCVKPDEVKENLHQWYLEYKRTGRVTYQGNMQKINKYSHREMARKYSEVLNQISGGL